MTNTSIALRYALVACAMVLLAAMALGDGSASAATFTVNSTLDAVDASPGDGVCADATSACTLRAAIMETNALPGADTVNLPAGTFTLTIAGAGEDAAASGDLDVTDDLTINGTGAATTAIDGGGLDRVLQIVGSAIVNISDIGARNGFLPLEFGGGVFNEGTLTATRMAVTGNTALGSAGIYSNGSTTIEGSTIFGNTVTYLLGFGGGIGNTGMMSITTTMVASNTAANGGGISNDVGGRLTIAESSINANTGVSLGGGIVNAQGASMNLTRTVVNDNQVQIGGGGIFNSGEMTASESTISNNRSELFGGGISSSSGTIVITNSTVSANETLFPFGGGFENRGSAVSLTNTTVSGNTGGGILNIENATLTINSSTVAFNNGFSSVGIVNSAGSLVQLKNTIIANSAGANCSGVINSAGHNLDSDATCALTGPGDLSNVDPLLGLLADNGGPTQTHALLGGSPAIDAGSADCPPPATDQRGTSRPQGAACDVGAFEGAAAAATPTPTPAPSATATPTLAPTPTPTQGPVVFPSTGGDGTASGGSPQAAVFAFAVPAFGLAAAIAWRLRRR